MLTVWSSRRFVHRYLSYDFVYGFTRPCLIVDKADDRKYVEVHELDSPSRRLYIRKDHSLIIIFGTG